MSIFFIILLLFMLLFFYGWKSKVINLLKPEDLEILGADEADLDRGKKISSTFFLVIVFLLIQLLFINIAMLAEESLSHTRLGVILNSFYLVNFIIICLNLILFFLIHHLIKFMGQEREEVIRRIKEKNALRLDWEKRAQLHDRNHHLGMLYMLIQTGYIDRARDYLQGMVGEIQAIESIVRTGNEVLNALVYSKMAKARQSGVQLQIEVLKGLNSMMIQDWELNRIIGNLLDNAIEAVEGLDGEKKVGFLLEGGEDHNLFKVITYGVYLADELETRIFQRGYSSKEGTGHGLGLAICKELVERYQGDILIEKDREDNYTAFLVKLPVSKTGS